MKTIIRTILILAAVLAHTAAAAQEGGLALRAGRSLSFRMHDTPAESHNTITATWSRGAGAAGLAVAIPPSARGALGLEGRTGFHAGGRTVSFDPYVGARCAWLDGAGEYAAAYGATVGLRLLGPLGVYLEASQTHRLCFDGTRLWLDRRGRLTLGAGVQITF